MTKGQRIITIVLSGVLLIAGFAFGRVTHSSNVAAEKTSEPVANNTQPNSPAYLSDYQMGYREGYNAGLSGQEANTPVKMNAAYSEREGYCSGFKEGFAKGYQTHLQSGSTSSGYAQPVAYSSARPVAYRSSSRTRVVYYERRPRRSSKLKTVLTIAAPAAIGAGIGGIAGGGKGAGIGALIGGGGGALYHLIKK